MNLDEYQSQALTTALHHPDPQMNKTIYAMGIAGEAGEVLDKWKKIVAYYDGEIDTKALEDIKKELGDVLWYIAVYAHELGLSLDDIAQLNLSKLRDRQDRGTIKGSGDHR